MQSPPLYEPFSVHVVPNRSEVAVVPAGELDLSCADQLEREVEGLWAVGFDRVVVDLRRLAFIDSAGLQVLMNLRNAARRDGRDLKLVPGPWSVERIFEVTGTRGLFDWRDY